MTINFIVLQLFIKVTTIASEWLYLNHRCDRECFKPRERFRKPCHPSWERGSDAIVRSSKEEQWERFARAPAKVPSHMHGPLASHTGMYTWPTCQHALPPYLHTFTDVATPHTLPPPHTLLARGQPGELLSFTTAWLRLQGLVRSYFFAELKGL